MSEQFSNRASSTLSAAVAAGDSTISVASATPFPSSGNFRIKVEDEYMLVTAVSGTTLTVTRGIESTTAAGHNVGTIVNHVLTVGGLAAKQTDMIMRGPIASLPAAGVAGRIYQTTDSVYRYYDNGSSWTATGPHVPLDFNSFSTGAWTDVGSGNLRPTVTPGAVLFNAPTTAGTFGFWSALAPATPYTVTFGFIVSMYPAQFNTLGVGWRDNSTGRIHNTAWTYTNTMSQKWALEIIRWDSGSTFNGVYQQINAYQIFPSGMMFLKLQNTGTQRTYYYSPDKFHWTQYYTCAVNEWTANPDRLVIYNKWDAGPGNNWMWLADYEVA